MADRDGTGFLRRRSRFGRTLGTVFGTFMLPAALALLGWNEVRAVDTERALAEGAGTVREAPADRIDPALDGKLVHVAGPMSVGDALADPDFPRVQALAGTVQLRRLVQTYQWQEVSSRGGSYSYRQVWSDQAIDSTRFHQPGTPRNPPPRYENRLLIAQDARLGPYRLTEPLLRAIGGGQPLALADGAAAAPGRPAARLDGNGVYVGGDPAAPEIGDQRLAWEAVRPTAASVVAQQQGAGFVPYRAKSGGASVHLISPGLLTAAEMLGRAEQANASETWTWRLAGSAFVFLSFFLVLRRWPGPRSGGLPPALHWIAGAGPARAGAVLTVIAAPAAIAAAWLAMRPAVGAGVLAGGLAMAWLLARRIRGRRAEGRR